MKGKREMLVEILSKAPVTYSSDYMEVRETEIEGKRYRLLQQFAGAGKQRRALVPVVQVLKDNKWRRVVD
jgi:inosine/xanthosine triphosphate pyrophosphatase family protein